MKRVLFCFFILLGSMIFAEEASFELGGKVGWQYLDFTENVEFTKGKLGFQAIKLASPNNLAQSDADLFLSFDSENIVDEAGNYTVKSTSYIQAGSKEAKFGSGTAMCSPHNKEPAIVLTPNEDSLFSGGKVLNSFSIEFWVYPKVTESGAIIFQWRSSLVENGKMMYQHIIASVLQNKMNWAFTNIWQKNNQGIDVQLKSRSNIIPNQWSHHLFTFNADTGMIEYRLNGVTEAIDYLTYSGYEGGEVFYNFLGSKSDVVIGLNYSGYIDELKILRIFKDVNTVYERQQLFDKYSSDGGRVESAIIDTGGNFSKAISFSADAKIPEQTGVEYFIRSADNQFNWTENSPEWKPICTGNQIDKTVGRYFQIAINLYPDGKRQISPVVNSVKLLYEKDSPALPPAKIWAEALDGAVKLSWTPSTDFDTEGYLVYFGERSGEYFYEGSPKDVGNVLSYTIDGLKNGRVYFFAISAYDKSGASNIGSFSKEVWARPKAEKKCKVELIN